MTIKFDHNNLPAFVRQGEFTTGVPAWWVTIGNELSSNEYRVLDGDYIIVDDSGKPTRYIPALDYANDLVVQALVREGIGEDLIRAIWAALRASSIPDAQKGGIVTTILTHVNGMIRDGEIVAARALAAGTGTNANYTAPVRTQLLGLMDTAIAKL